MQMIFYCDLYISENLESKKEKILKKLETNSLQPFVYVITLAQGKQNHLEFYSSLLLKQHIYEETPLFVVGIAKGYDDALYLIEHIVNDIYKKTEDTDIRSYIMNRQQEYEEGRV
ncbi:MAG: hypothetical protein QM793_11335 [Muricomes sp.]